MAEKRKDSKGRILRSGEFQLCRDDRYAYEYRDIDGKRKRVYAVTLQELREKEKKIQRDLQDGINTKGGEITLNEMFQACMALKCNLKDSTRHNYLIMWENRVENSDIGKMKICQLRQMHIATFCTDLINEGLADSTVKLLHFLISNTLEVAVENDLIRKNPAKNARTKGGTKKEKVALTRKQQSDLMEFLEEEDNIYAIHRPMIQLALATGLRVGELTGLRWSDVDYKEKVLHIRQQLVYKNLDGKGCTFHIRELKTDAGRRDIPLTDSVRESLRQQREYSQMLGRDAEKMIVDGVSDFVFTNKNGKPYATNAINAFLDNIVNDFNKAAWRAGREADSLPHISAHILRHTACTRFAESGLDPKVLQYIMGHADIGVTMNIYTHLDMEDIKEKVNASQRKAG
ncbi:MAG: tyrosine-type recombinase/integrase [Lachnospiraceae bacterium]|nr:tyrosine-type recombinase/integrase [Lachnospiraceae bacterium]